VIRYFFLVAFVAASAHAERTADYAAGVPIVPEGPQPFQKVEVPAVVYEGAVRPGLADVRVFNADGELVPFAWLPRPAAVRERPPSVVLPSFPLYVDRERRDVAGLALHVVRNAAGTTVDIKSADETPAARQELGGYVLDASELSAPLNALMFALPETAAAPTMHLRVDSSDDLASWRSMMPDATLVNLEYAGRRLTRNRVEIPPTKAKYLRLSWTVGQPVIEFTSISGEFAERVVEAPRQWREAPGTPVADRAGEFEYDLGGAFPVDRIDINLAEPNSIAPAEILARAATTEPWQPVASTVFYRLREPGGDVTSAPVTLAGGERRYWLLRFDPRSGVSARVAPQLRAGWQPAELVFAARGSPPFTLAYGNRVASPGTLPIATLVPGYESGKGLPANVGVARVGQTIALGGPARLREPPDVKRWMLWASLALGAVVLGWMAWRLSREMGPAPDGHATRDAAPPPD
jgi:hypothetical protein